MRTEDWTLAQRSVIGSMLIDPDCIARVAPEMRREDFSGVLADIFSAISDMLAAGETIDPVTVLGRIGDTPQLRELMRDLMRDTPTSANVSEYVRICREQSRILTLRQIGAKLFEAQTLEDSLDLISQAAAISMESDTSRSVSAAKAVTDWWQSFVAGETPEYIKCGIGCLDNLISTVSGNYNIIAGYTSHGKTALALQMAWGIAEKHRVGCFCYECSKDEWTQRLLSSVGQVELKKIKDMTPDAEETKRLSAAATKIYNREIYYEDASGWTVSDIFAQCVRMRYDVIFVDYLQIVKSPADKYGRLAAVTDTSIRLRELSAKNKITVFALSQLSRSQRTLGDFVFPPTLADLRESGQLEQDANAVIMVHAPLKDKEPVYRILSVPKNRSGETGYFYADFLGGMQTFTEPSPENFQRWKKYMDVARSGHVPNTDARDGPSDYLTAAVKKRKKKEEET